MAEGTNRVTAATARAVMAPMVLAMLATMAALAALAAMAKSLGAGATMAPVQTQTKCPSI
jgi:hypothetical protein